MSRMAQFAAYAAAFEKAFDNDEWDALAPFFAADAVYEIGLSTLGADRCEGREEILAWFPVVLDRLDRRFESRTLKLLDAPKEEGDEVSIRGAATYTSPGVPDFVLTLEEIVRFEGDQIVHLEDRYTPEMVAEFERYVRDHGERLGLDITLPDD